jgi:hypothetical protein
VLVREAGVKNAVEFVQAVENMLGWVPKEPRWKTYVTEAGKVKKKIATDPDLYTFENLGLALALLQHERKSVDSPAGVLFHVERASKMGEVAAPTDDVDDDIDVLIERLSVEGDPDGWVQRLVRASGAGRELVMDEYRRTHVQQEA